VWRRTIACVHADRQIRQIVTVLFFDHTRK